jgi:hypothetical protein
MRVKCYWNLNQAKQGNYVFSVVNLADGKVDGYTGEIAIRNAKFHVNQNARLKIAGGQKKSVHAWITGDRVDVPALDGFSEATYNPRRDEFFVDVATGQRLGVTSPLVVLRSENKRGVIFHK